MSQQVAHSARLNLCPVLLQSLHAGSQRSHHHPTPPSSIFQHHKGEIKCYLTYINAHFRLSNLTFLLFTFLLFWFPGSFNFCCLTCVLIKSLKTHLRFHLPSSEICLSRLRSISWAENNFSYKNYRVSTTQFGKIILDFNVSHCFPLSLGICSDVGHKAEFRPVDLNNLQLDFIFSTI